MAVDPGPGALVRMCVLRPLVDPNHISGMLLTHRHIDHSGDCNSLAEAMTEGGRRPGILTALPSDAIDDEPVLYRNLRDRFLQLVRWSDLNPVQSPGGTVRPISLRHHGVECYGLRFDGSGIPKLGLISDTAYLPKLERFFHDREVIVANVTLLENRPPIQHLSVPDMARFLRQVYPKLLVMTHLGTSILKNDPEALATQLCTEDTTVIAATDGMILDLNHLPT